MIFDKSFLEDEVRLGFYIPSTIKQCWAAELEILKVIDKICSDCNIEYFADWGTFLGAIRHNGFIPWDDDIDLVMRREDYDAFLSQAPSLLPAGYSIHTFRNEEGFREFHAVVINTEHPHFDKEHFDEFHGFPYNCGIDIFVLDYVHSNEEKENKRVNDALFLIALADGIIDKTFTESVQRANLLKAELICNTSFTNISDVKKLWIKLYESAEKKCSEVKRDQSDVLTQMVPWGLKKQINRRYKKTDYDKSIRIKFENTTIPVPLFYDSLLSGRYGNYMTLVKNAGAHDYPYYENQKKDLEKLFKFPFPTFCFDVSKTTTRTFSSSDNWKCIVKECLSEISNYNHQITNCSDSISDALINAQQLSIDLGTLIEEIKGEGHLCIPYIEKYCEDIFYVFSLLESGLNTSDLLQSLNNLNVSFEQMNESILSNLLKRKEVVFLPFKGAYWNSLKPFYTKYLQDSDYDVYVIPLPYYYKEYDGTLSNEQYDLSAYPDDLPIIPYVNFSLEYHHPDTIFIQNPYDEFNASTSIHPDFYCKIIRNYTDELIYVPWFNKCEFNIVKDPRSYKNMEFYAITPGVLYSDKIYLFSQIEKDNYISLFSSKFGKHEADFVSKKITVVDLCASSFSHSHKSILYFLEVGPVCQNIDCFIEKTTQNLALLNNSEIKPYFSFSTSLIDSLKKFYPEIATEFLSIVQNTDCFLDPAIINLSQEFINQFDAFYGDAGSLATAFSHYHKPVMIQNYNI